MASLLYLMSFFDSPPPCGPVEHMSRETDLHLTLMPAFSVPDRTMGSFRRTVAAITDWFPTIACDPTGATVFGLPPDSVPVVLYDAHAHAPHSLFNLHASLSEGLKQSGGSYLDPYVGSKYTPHSSYGEASVTQIVRTLTLIEHRGGFGEDMVALQTYGLQDESV